MGLEICVSRRRSTPWENQEFSIHNPESLPETSLAIVSKILCSVRELSFVCELVASG